MRIQKRESLFLNRRRFRENFLMKSSIGDRLEAAIRQHSAGASSASGSAFPGSGQSLSGSPVPTEAPPAEAFNYLKYFLIAMFVTLWYQYSKNS